MLSFPAGTKMFQFPAFALTRLCIQRAVVGITPHRFPDSEIPGSMSASDSPGLIAAVHVLHRLPIPRHPPYALTYLTVSLRRMCEYKNALQPKNVKFSKTYFNLI